MNIVRGFLTDPEVLFLDEPTLGLDVGASRDVRKFIIEWLKADKERTLLLTTHYMVEAAVSYTHLTLPTSELVQFSVVAVSLKKQIPI